MAALLGEGKIPHSCREANFKVKAISADYQAMATEPVSAYPDAIKRRGPSGKLSYVYVNEIPGIRNSRFYNPILSAEIDGTSISHRGHSLLYKFAAALVNDQSQGADLELSRWLLNRESGLLKLLMPNPFEPLWKGRCEIWSFWSVDPDLIQSLSGVGSGLMCNGVPFTRGELKELITVLYPFPKVLERLRLNQMVRRESDADPYQVEEFNITLARLGALGNQNELTPDLLFSKAEEAISLRRNILLDIDPGLEIWNQPIEAIADLIFDDPTTVPTALPAMIDFAEARPEMGWIYSNFVSAEQALKQAATSGSMRAIPELCELAHYFNHPCLPRSAGLEEQLDLFFAFREIALRKDLMVSQEPKLERHLLTIQYGVEGEFSRSRDEASRTRTFEYVRIGNRSVWSPSTRKLSEICTRFAFDRDERNSLFARADLKKSCEFYKKGLTRDHLVFSGSFPPKKLDVFKAGPVLDGGMKSRAFLKLRDMIDHCPRLTKVTDFLLDFELSLSKNEWVPGWVEAFPRVKGDLDLDYLKDRVKGSAPDLQGSLRAVLQK